MLKLWKNVQHWWERPGAKQEWFVCAFEKPPQVQIFSRLLSIIVATSHSYLQDKRERVQRRATRWILASENVL